MSRSASSISGIRARTSAGSNERRLTEGKAVDRTPSFSPDGKTIVFSRKAVEGEDRNIFTVGVDGAGEDRLTGGSALDIQPSYSPDGRKIAFARHGGGARIVVMDADGGNLEPLSNTDRAGDEAPSWSPDGERIAFERVVDRVDQVFTMASDGSGVEQLTSDRDLHSRQPAFSPNGNKIIFRGTSIGGGNPTALYLMNDRGGDPDRLTPLAANEGVTPNWAPRVGKAG